MQFAATSRKERTLNSTQPQDSDCCKYIFKLKYHIFIPSLDIVHIKNQAIQEIIPEQIRSHQEILLYYTKKKGHSRRSVNPVLHPYDAFTTSNLENQTSHSHITPQQERE